MVNTSNIDDDVRKSSDIVCKENGPEQIAIDTQGNANANEEIPVDGEDKANANEEIPVDGEDKAIVPEEKINSW